MIGSNPDRESSHWGTLRNFKSQQCATSKTCDSGLTTGIVICDSEFCLADSLREVTKRAGIYPPGTSN